METIKWKKNGLPAEKTKTKYQAKKNNNYLCDIVKIMPGALVEGLETDGGGRCFIAASSRPPPTLSFPVFYLVSVDLSKS